MYKMSTIMKVKKIIVLIMAICLANGMSAQNSTDFNITTIRQQAEEGNAEAQNKLAECYYTGENVIQDYKEAAKWWEKAAEQGHAKSQYN